MVDEGPEILGLAVLVQTGRQDLGRADLCRGRSELNTQPVFLGSRTRSELVSLRSSSDGSTRRNGTSSTGGSGL